MKAVSVRHIVSCIIRKNELYEKSLFIVYQYFYDNMHIVNWSSSYRSFYGGTLEYGRPANHPGNLFRERLHQVQRRRHH